jgi:hypothetical protein
VGNSLQNAKPRGIREGFRNFDDVLRGHQCPRPSK